MSSYMPGKNTLSGKKTYPLSHPQKRIWFSEKLYNVTNYSNITISFNFHRSIDYGLLKDVIDYVYIKNESLRTRIFERDGLPRQYFEKHHSTEIFMKYFLKEGDISYRHWLNDYIAKPIGLSESSLIEFSLVKFQTKNDVLFIKTHHIISDAWTNGLLCKQITDCYNKFSKNEPFEIEETSYVNYIENELKYKESKRFMDNKAFWHSVFRDLPEQIFTHNKKTSFTSERKNFLFSVQHTKKITRFCNSEKISLYNFLFSVLSILVYKYFGVKNFIIGTLTHNRFSRTDKKTPGMFVNTLPIRIRVDPDKTFYDLNCTVQNSIAGSFKNQKYPYDLLLSEIKTKFKKKDDIIDIVFSYDEVNYSIPINWHYNNEEFFPLVIHATRRSNSNRLNFEFDFRHSCLSGSQVDTFFSFFKSIINEIIKKPDSKLYDFRLLSEKKYKKRLLECNDTTTDYNKKLSLVDLFEKQLTKNGNNTALYFRDQNITYNDLNKKINQFSNYIIERKNKHGLPIAIIMDSSIEMIIAIFAILKSGSPYLPIDPEYPVKRIEYMLEDSRAEILITQDRYNEDVVFTGTKIIFDYGIFDRYSDRKPNIHVSSEDVAYIMYTSGSTGRPKGILTRHYSISRICINTNYIDIRSNDRLVKLSNYAFDGSTFDLFASLLNGAKLFLLSKDDIMEIGKLAEFIYKKKITIFFITTALFNTLVDLNMESLKNVKKILFGGERASYRHVEKAYNFFGAKKLIHVYGPTESTVFASFHQLNSFPYDFKTIPIGKPISNTKIYILDRELNICPPGIAGEICISGDGLAAGYLNQEKLTNERFINNPFFRGEKIYLTGDVGKWNRNGDIEFIGRLDNQVKIRGNRIEPGEIELSLMEHPEIEKVIVISREDASHNKYLAAYYVSRESIDHGSLRKFLLEKLPESMVPSYFMRLSKIPLTQNGKIDKINLPDLSILPYARRKYTAPKTNREKEIKKIWEDILNIGKVGINDGFFDIGGNSIKLIQIHAELSRHYAISIDELFEYDTIKTLSDHIGENGRNVRKKIEVLREKGFPNISPEERSHIKRSVDSYRGYTAEYEKVDCSKKNNYKSILLTGATGFLGIYLLHDFLENHSCNIFLIIRGRNTAHSRKRIIDKYKYYFNKELDSKDFNRLFILNGDISKDRLELEKKQYENLSEKIDCIINSAANVKHYGIYNDFYSVNVNGVKNIVKLSITGKKKDIYHISTVGTGIAGIKERNYFILSEITDPPNSDIANFYIKTKIIAEEIIIEARKQGLNTNIIRVGNLTFNSVDGKFQENINDNAFYKSIRSYIKLRMIPNIQYKIIDFSCIDYVSRAVFLITGIKNLKNEVYHIINNDFKSLYDIGLLLSKRIPDIKFYEYNEFLDFLHKNSNNKKIKEHVNNILLHSHIIKNPYIGGIIYLNDRTNLILKKLGFEWNSIKIDLIEKMLNHCYLTGFL